MGWDGHQLFMVRGHPSEKVESGWLVVEAPPPPWQRLETLDNRPQQKSPSSLFRQASPANGKVIFLGSPGPEQGLV